MDGEEGCSAGGRLPSGIATVSQKSNFRVKKAGMK
jgi:hypothetical protein